VIVSTINVNGVRAAIKQRSPENLGLLPWLAETRADVVCLQETRAEDDQLADALGPALSNGPPRKLGVPPGIWHRLAEISRAATELPC
jgi:Endonuclease/Exonuclease/phosphatase family